MSSLPPLPPITAAMVGLPSPLDCRETVYDGPWGRRHRCTRRATDAGFCKQHGPTLKAAKNAKRSAEYEARSQRDWIASMAPAMLACLVALRDGRDDWAEAARLIEKAGERP